MAHMQFDAGIDELVRLDGPMQKGPIPRWQRKAMDTLGRFALAIFESDETCSHKMRGFKVLELR